MDLSGVYGSYDMVGVRRVLGSIAENYTSVHLHRINVVSEIPSSWTV